MSSSSFNDDEHEPELCFCESTFRGMCVDCLVMKTCECGKKFESDLNKPGDDEFSTFRNKCYQCNEHLYTYLKIKS